MTKLDIAISSIKYSIETNDEELESFKKIAKSLNQKTNELMMATGKISDRLLLFILLLINTNKKEQIFQNFEENIIKLIKAVVPILSNAGMMDPRTDLNNSEKLDIELILSNIIVENETSALKEDKTTKMDKNTAKIIEENEKSNEETIKLLDEIIRIIKKLNENISKV